MEDHRRTEGEPFPGAEFLLGDDPMQVMDRLIETGAFHLEERAEHFLLKSGLLLFPERYAARVFARVAYEAMSYRGDPPLTEWLNFCLDKAGGELLREQFDEQARHVPIASSLDREYYEQVSEATGYELELARLVCLTGNRFDDDRREAGHACVVKGESVNRDVAEGNGPPEGVKELLTSATRTFLLVLAGSHGEGGNA